MIDTLLATGPIRRLQRSARSRKNHALPTALFYCVHKGGSTFIADRLVPEATAELPPIRHVNYGQMKVRQQAYETEPLPPTGLIATRVYPDIAEALVEEPASPMGRFADKRIVVVMRDPRDVLVSLYHSVTKSHDPKGVARPEEWRQKRDRYREMPPEEAMLELAQGSPLQEFIAATDLVRSHPAALHAPYELMVTDFKAWLRSVGEHLFWPSSVCHHLHRLLAPELAPPEVESPDQHKRRVTPGNHRDVFSSELHDLFERLVGPRLRSFGYETPTSGDAAATPDRSEPVQPTRVSSDAATAIGRGVLATRLEGRVLSLRRHVSGTAQHLAMAVVRRVVPRTLRPRLGVLHQYAPRELVWPTSYLGSGSAAEDQGKSDQPMPTVSIVTPSFGQAGFIKRTMDSVLDQGYPALEYVVQDGGSTDGTRGLLDDYADRLHSAASEPDSGQAQAINRGFARTSGEIMAWLNSDDLLAPGAIEYAAKYFANNPGVDVIYGHRVLIDTDDREIGTWILPPHCPDTLRWADFVPQETMFWRRSLWDRVGGGLDESLQFALDWDLLLRFAEAGATIRRVPRFMGAFRIHEDQKTSSQISEQGRHEMALLRERTLGFRPDGYQINRRLLRYMLSHIGHHVAYRAGWVQY